MDTTGSFPYITFQEKQSYVSETKEYDEVKKKKKKERKLISELRKKKK